METGSKDGQLEGLLLISRELGKLSGIQIGTNGQLDQLNATLIRLEADGERKHGENVKMIAELSERITTLEKWRTGIMYVGTAIGVIWTAVLGYLGMNRSP